MSTSAVAVAGAGATVSATGRARRGAVVAVNMPAALKNAVVMAAAHRKVSVAGFVKESIAHFLKNVVVNAPPREGQSLEELDESIRQGLMSWTTDGQLKGQQLRASYMRFCADCKAVGIERASFDEWSAGAELNQAIKAI